MKDNEDKSDLNYWIRELTTAATDASWYSTRRADNYDTRLAYWDGQSSDGRKWGGNYRKKIFPWEGASDARIRLADFVSNRETQLCLTATFSSRLQMLPVESTDGILQQRSESLLKWMLYTHFAVNSNSPSTSAPPTASP